MLDDQNYLNNLDPKGALDVAASQASQLAVKFDVTQLRQPKNIVLAGMGGSALSGLIAQAWLADELEIPFEIVREYELPGYVSEDSLVISYSYSGNTEEALSMLNDAQNKSAQIVCVAFGGQLQERAEEAGIPFLQLPDTGQPRYAALVGLQAIAHIFDKSQVTNGLVHRVSDAQTFVDSTISHLAKDVPLDKNPAKKLALELAGKSMVIFGGPLMKAAAYKWKISFNENAKNVAFWNEWPEFNHNEFIGWSSHPQEKPFGVVQLVSDQEPLRIRDRYRISNKLLSGKMPEPHQVEMCGDNKLEHLLYGVVYGDFVTLYTAILNGVNPTPVDLVEKLKEELKQIN